MTTTVHHTIRYLAAALFLLLGLGCVTTAAAIDLDAAKAQGLVGETPSGYLAPVQEPPSPAVEALVERINRERRARYEAIAEKNDIEVSAVEKLAGKKAIEKTPPGQYVLAPEGRWVKK